MPQSSHAVGGSRSRTQNRKTYWKYPDSHVPNGEPVRSNSSGSAGTALFVACPASDPGWVFDAALLGGWSFWLGGFRGYGLPIALGKGWMLNRESAVIRWSNQGTRCRADGGCCQFFVMGCVDKSCLHKRNCWPNSVSQVAPNVSFTHHAPALSDC